MSYFQSVRNLQISSEKIQQLLIYLLRGREICKLKRVDYGAKLRRVESQCATCLLCDLGQNTEPLCHTQYPLCKMGI